MLLVTIQDFALRDQPVIRLASGSGLALRVEFEGTTADFLFQAERHYAGPGPCLHNFRPGF